MVRFFAPHFGIRKMRIILSSRARHLIAGEVPENSSCRVDQAKERTQGSNQKHLKKHSGKLT